MLGFGLLVYITSVNMIIDQVRLNLSKMSQNIMTVPVSRSMNSVRSQLCIIRHQDISNYNL